MDAFRIKIDDKPHLKEAMQRNPELAKEVISTFAQMMDDAFKEGWAELPKKFHPGLTFKALIHDILHGVLDLKEIDPRWYDDLGTLVHPFGLFSYRPHGDIGGYYDYQRHFDLKKGDLPDIQSILRKLMYYSRYIEIDKFGEAMLRKEMDLYMVDRDPSPLIAAHPAIMYQRKNLGERFAGKFMDKYGLLDCGKLVDNVENCPACVVGTFIDLPDVVACKKCGAGFHKPVDS